MEAALLPTTTALAARVVTPVDVQDVLDDPGPGCISARASPVNKDGLHARPAAQIAEAVAALVAQVTVGCEDRSADAASSLELMTLRAGLGMELVVSAQGPEAALAVQAVVDLVEAGFGELPVS